MFLAGRAVSLQLVTPGLMTITSRSLTRAWKDGEDWGAEGSAARACPSQHSPPVGPSWASVCPSAH